MSIVLLFVFHNASHFYHNWCIPFSELIRSITVGRPNWWCRKFVSKAIIICKVEFWWFHWMAMENVGSNQVSNYELGLLFLVVIRNMWRTIKSNPLKTFDIFNAFPFCRNDTCALVVLAAIILPFVFSWNDVSCDKHNLQVMHCGRPYNFIRWFNIWRRFSEKNFEENDKCGNYTCHLIFTFLSIVFWFRIFSFIVFDWHTQTHRKYGYHVADQNTSLWKRWPCFLQYHRYVGRLHA